MTYLYTFGFPINEEQLCRLEMRAFFNDESLQGENVLISPIKITANRSPFIRERVQIDFETTDLQELIEFAKSYEVASSFKLVCINDAPIGKEPKITLKERRKLEIAVGETMPGNIDLNHPEVEIAIVKIENRYYFGPLQRGEAVWEKHIDRPVQYSTALSSRQARALFNITAPDLSMRVVDPCCGVGTVVIEGLSMGANVLGRDMNWHVTTGSRKNIAHFGYDGVIELGPIEEIKEAFDAAIIDMPYNLFTKSSDEARQSIVNSAAKIAERIVLVSSEDLTSIIEQANLKVVDFGTIQKHLFIRNVYVCYKNEQAD